MKVALSYSGETEDRVGAISRIIQNDLHTPQSPNSVFYVPDFQDELTGLDGMQKLLKIYRNASLVVVFLSTNYSKSPFCIEEWRSIKERFMYGEGRNQLERLFFVKLTDFDAQELNLVSDDFYIDGLNMDNQQIADQILSRWRKIRNTPRQ